DYQQCQGQAEHGVEAAAETLQYLGHAAPFGLTDRGYAHGFLLRISNPGIKQTVEQVHHDVEHYEYDCHGQDGSLDDGKIPGPDGIDCQPAQAGPGEDCFGQDGTAQ